MNKRELSAAVILFACLSGLLLMEALTTEACLHYWCLESEMEKYGRERTKGMFFLLSVTSFIICLYFLKALAWRKN